MLDKKEIKLRHLWSQIIKLKAGYKCEICRTKGVDETLHAHHFFSKKSNTVKFEIENGICLCPKCHNILHTHPTLSKIHKNRIIIDRGEKWYDKLRRQSKGTCKLDFDEIDIYLKAYKREIESQNIMKENL